MLQCFFFAFSVYSVRISCPLNLPHQQLIAATLIVVLHNIV